MKFLKALATTACALAVAAAAHAATYTDSSDNYELNHMLATGDNGGDGFGAWEIETHGSGQDGAWAGCGIWDPSANNFQGDWAGKATAFGIIGKGDGYGVNAYRPFRAPLAVGDSFSLEMGVNWDPNAGIDALKGFALLAEGGTFQVLTINHRSNPGNIAINGNADSEILNAFGVFPMKWTFTAKDATTITVTATSRADPETVYEQDWEVGTSAIDGFRLQSSNQNPYEDAQAAEEQGETAQMWADRRQTYFDNFTLDVAAELPDLTDLEFTGGEYAVTSNNQELSYTLKRSSSDGELTVNVKSSFEAFIPSTTATFADGESETTFTVTATLQPKAENKADLTVSGVGCNPAVYANVRAPRYRFSSDTATVEKDATANIWINWDDNGVRDDSKLAFVADPEDIVTLPAAWELTDEAKDDGGNYIGLYGQTSISGVAYGYTLLALTYDGVVVGDWGFTVPAPLVPGFELSGNTAPKTGIVAVYTLKATLDGAEEGCNVTVAPSDGVTVDPASFDLVEPDEEGGFVYSQPIEVTFANPGDYTIKAKSLNYSAELPVSVSEPADFSDYVAYDDASLYDGNFDFASTGAGQEGFGAWQVIRSGAEYGNVDVGGGDAGMPSILSDDGKALFLYGNGGEDPAYAVVRPFANTLQPGQKASVEFVASEAGGSRVVRFVRIEEGGIYNRFEIWNNSGNIGINVDGVETAIDWPNGLRRVEASIELAADGSSYTLELLGHNPDSDLLIDDIYQHVVNSDVGYWGGGIQGIYFEGTSTEGDLVFNRLAIEQVEDPIEPPPPAVTMEWTAGVWNPDEVGVPYTFGLKSSETGAIGLVDLSVEPAEGIELSTAQIDLSEGEATFTVTLTGDELPAETKFTITAKAQAEGVEDATYGLTAKQPYSELYPVNGQYTYDYAAGGTVEFQIVGSPSRVGTTVDLDSDNESILLPPDSRTAVVGAYGSEDGKFTYTMPGLAEGETYIHARYEGAEWGYAGITINGMAGDDVEIPAPAYVKGQGLSWDASILDDGFVLRGTDTLRESPDKDSWTDLVEGTDYVVENGQVVVLYSSAYNYIALLKK